MSHWLPSGEAIKNKREILRACAERITVLVLINGILFEYDLVGDEPKMLRSLAGLEEFCHLRNWRLTVLRLGS